MNGDSFKLLPTLEDKSFDIVLTDRLNRKCLSIELENCNE